MNFKAKLLELLKNKFRKQKHVFAKNIGVSAAMISKYLSGECLPAFKTALKIRQESDGSITLRDMGFDVD